MSLQGIIILQKFLFSHTFLCTSSFFLSRKNEGNSDNKKSPWCLEVISLNDADSFLLEDNTIFLHLELLKEQLVFHNLSYALKHKQDIFFSFLVYKTLRAIVTLFFSDFFQSFFSDGKFIPFQIFFHDLTRLLQHYFCCERYKNLS